MTPYTPFKEIFKDVSLEVEDLYLLESFQINMLPGIADRDLAVILWAHPSIKRFLIKKCPPVADYIDDIMNQYKPAEDDRELKNICLPETVRLRPEDDAVTDPASPIKRRPRSNPCRIRRNVPSFVETREATPG